MRTAIILFDLIRHRAIDRSQKVDTTVKQVPHYSSEIELWIETATTAFSKLTFNRQERPHNHVGSILQERPKQQEEEAGTMSIMNMAAQQDHNDEPSLSSSSEKQAASESVNFPQKVSSLCIYYSEYSTVVIC
jgi:hypothetical protein